MIVCSTKALRWDGVNQIFSGYVSDLGAMMDAPAQFYLESHKTNTRVKFVLISTDRDDEGDIQG